MLIERVVVNVKSDSVLPLIPNYKNIDFDACHPLNRKCLRVIASGGKLRKGISGTFLLVTLVLEMFMAVAPAFGQSLAPEAASPEQHPPHRYRRVTLDDQLRASPKTWI
jgi:hypothetical protein